MCGRRQPVRTMDLFGAGLPALHLFDQGIILSMRTDPEPYGGIVLNNTHRAPVNPYPDRMDRLA